MDQQKWMQVGIDYDEGVTRFVGNAQMYESFLQSFLQDGTFAALEAAMAAKDVEAAFQAGHTLKGLSGNLSLTALYQSLVTFVDALRGEGNWPLAQSLFPAVRADYQLAVDFITANLC